MEPIARRVFIAGLALIATPALANDRPLPVGYFGDVRNLHIEGNHTFSADQLIQAVLSHLATQAAAHPSAPLDRFRELLCQRLAAGYRHAGFPYAFVSSQIDLDQSRLTLRISEGPQFLAGPLSVQGNTRIPADALV